jgi:Zn finger protein HypA/HybF involved in hydrogenase expression
MDCPKNINYGNLKAWVDSQKPTEEYRVVKASDLTRIAGGLYRIRDDYTSVWTMKAGEDGRSYIVRADDESERMYIAESDTSQNQKAAFKTITAAGDVHVVWECDDCQYSNITKEGEGYECGQCHVNTPDVFGQGEVLPAGMTVQDAVASYGPPVGAMMRKFGLNSASKELVELWSKTAAMYKCEDCGHDYVSDSSDTCPKCDSPQVRQAKQAEKTHMECASDGCSKCRKTIQKAHLPAKNEEEKKVRHHEPARHDWSWNKED